uniref:Uncharacterized protein n=1 Tax=Pithovirus LCPAC406 TaxID=2506599 RepID=A0A481ZHG3_9VIRU|nr:MAG: hypothetical protein LCPAC406_03530 [Pithovirus LCPAC406]
MSDPLETYWIEDIGTLSIVLNNWNTDYNFNEEEYETIDQLLNNMVEDVMNKEDEELIMKIKTMINDFFTRGHISEEKRDRCSNRLNMFRRE